VAVLLEVSGSKVSLGGVSAGPTHVLDLEFSASADWKPGRPRKLIVPKHA